MIEVILGRCIILWSHVSEEDLCGLRDEFHIAEIEASRGCFRVEDLMNWACLVIILIENDCGKSWYHHGLHLTTIFEEVSLGLSLSSKVLHESARAILLLVESKSLLSLLRNLRRAVLWVLGLWLFWLLGYWLFWLLGLWLFWILGFDRLFLRLVIIRLFFFVILIGTVVDDDHSVEGDVDVDIERVVVYGGDISV